MVAGANCGACPSPDELALALQLFNLESLLGSFAFRQLPDDATDGWAKGDDSDGQGCVIAVIGAVPKAAATHIVVKYDA
jgi:hypothetical protein